MVHSNHQVLGDRLWFADRELRFLNDLDCALLVLAYLLLDSPMLINDTSLTKDCTSETKKQVANKDTITLFNRYQSLSIK